MESVGSFEAKTHLAQLLELAIRRGLPLACNDGKLKNAAVAAGVALFTPP